MTLDEALAPLLTGVPGYALAAFLGLVFGSFANVCIYRMPEGRSVVSPGSHCGVCGTPVRWYDNLPVVSYLVLRGRCRACGTEFSPRYLLVEVATALLFVGFFHLVMALVYAGEPLPLRLGRFGVYAAFSFTMVVITFIDLDTKLILDKVTFPAIPLFYGLGLTLPERTWQEGLIGIAVGYGVVRLIADGYRLLAGRDGMGYGDGKLLAVIGALFGWKAVVFALFGGSLLGTAIAVPVLVWQRRGGSTAAAAASAGPPHADDPNGDPSGDPSGNSDAQAPGADISADVDGRDTAGNDDARDDRDDALRHVELPFGPYLAAAALVYAFVETWLPITVSELLVPRG